MSRLPVIQPKRSATFVLALALAVWLAATLGLVHRTVHVPGLGTVAALTHAPGPAAGDAQAPAHAHAPGIAGLFEIHANGDVDCRLYDQLAHGSATPSVPLLALPVFLPAATFAWLEGEVLARWVALFDARGPPSSR